jgi:hypothetical protein
MHDMADTWPTSTPTQVADFFAGHGQCVLTAVVPAPGGGLAAHYMKQLCRLLTSPSNVWRHHAITRLYELLPGSQQQQQQQSALQPWLDMGLVHALLECLCEWHGTSCAVACGVHLSSCCPLLSLACSVWHSLLQLLLLLCNDVPEQDTLLHLE